MITKKLAIVLIGALFTVGVLTLATPGGMFGAPVLEAVGKNVFRVDIIRCGPAVATTTTPGADGCGSNLAASDPLTSGRVDVMNNGKVRVILKGAAAEKTYLVLVHNWTLSNGANPQFTGTGGVCGGPFAEIGTITTNGAGGFKGQVITAAGDFVFPSATGLGQPNFVFNDLTCTRTQFTTGFRIP